MVKRRKNNLSDGGQGVTKRRANMKIEEGTLHREGLDKERATLVNHGNAVALPSRFRFSESPSIITIYTMFLKCVVKVHTHIHISVMQIVRTTTHRGKSTQANRQRPDLSDDAFADNFPQTHQVSETQKTMRAKNPGTHTGQCDMWRAKNVPSQRSTTKNKNHETS